MAMEAQKIFKRYEMKYLITPEQRQRIEAVLADRANPDLRGSTTVRNVYFDTPDHLLIRRSIEKPIYKEKLRLRSYHRATAQSEVFVELKKKYQGVVYKRRVNLPEQQAMAWLCGSAAPPQKDQISREVAYFLTLYPLLAPRVFLSYDRSAYFALDDPFFRITFDENICARQEQLSLTQAPGGTLLLPRECCLMELKSPGSIPLWMAQLLSREGIYKTSFSKYGVAYRQLIFKRGKDAATYV